MSKLTIRRRYSHEITDATVAGLNDEVFVLTLLTTDDADHSMNMTREVLELLQKQVAVALERRKPQARQA